MTYARRALLWSGGLLAATAIFSACGDGSSGSSSTKAPPTTPVPSSTSENNPAGDIPDNQVYVPFSPPGGGFSIKVPEGWARSQSGTATTFTDKLNSIRIETMSASAAPTIGSATTQEVPKIRSGAHGFVPGKVTTVHRKAGQAVLITYRADSAPDPVTGKTVTDAVERYDFWHAGREVVLTLSGPTGADNVDPWKLVSDSLRWT
ncbi:hypothetical protein [Actinoallomurus sp. CA-142502]|uniref:hypothetical protein n=1 Tax=Actinoallomurus sp. CA-142502 TaxID=3239885 RepID=UPI003D8FC8AB